MTAAVCELFAMSARHPATVRLSFSELARRGGATGPHADGWGVGFFEGRDVRLIREPTAASESPFARLVSDQSIRSRNVVAHVRKATRGERTLSNTQPFVREVLGRVHCFAHNGHLADLDQLSSARFRPVGDTDSERAFCSLLDGIAPLWVDGPPPLAMRLEVVAAFARQIAPLGPANFIYCDSDALFAHGNRRTQADGVIRAPGLHMLTRSCAHPARPVDTDAVVVEHRATDQQVVLFASVPLTAEPWTALDEGQVVVVRNGDVSV